MNDVGKNKKTKALWIEPMWSNVPLWHAASQKKTKVVAGVLEDSRVITRIIVV